MMEKLLLENRYILRPSNPADAQEVLPDIREDDLIEWQRSVTGGVEGNLQRSIETAAECWTIAGLDLPAPHIIFGVHDTLPLPNTWMLGTNHGQSIAAVLLYECRAFYDDFFKRWPNTRCYSDPRNVVHHRWLRFMGYGLTSTPQWGDYNHIFLEFTKREFK